MRANDIAQTLREATKMLHRNIDNCYRQMQKAVRISEALFKEGNFNDLSNKD